MQPCLGKKNQNTREDNYITTEVSMFSMFERVQDKNLSMSHPVFPFLDYLFIFNSNQSEEA